MYFLLQNDCTSDNNSDVCRLALLCSRNLHRTVTNHIGHHSSSIKRIRSANVAPIKSPSWSPCTHCDQFTSSKMYVPKIPYDILPSSTLCPKLMLSASPSWYNFLFAVCPTKHNSSNSFKYRLFQEGSWSFGSTVVPVSPPTALGPRIAFISFGLTFPTPACTGCTRTAH
jgi:hypothetical protein